LTGAGEAFCAGGDVSGHSTLDPVERAHQMQERNVAAVWALINMRKPLVAAVNGVAVGAGLRLALLADIAVVSESTRLIDGHTRIGIAAGDHSVLIWPLLCGMAQAKNVLMRTKALTGREAYEMGLVSECVEQEQVLSTAIDIAIELSTGPQWAIRATKRALNHWLRLAGPAYEHSAALEALNTLHEDSAVGRRAVLAKQTPKFPSSQT
jgi:enoyl-CoA hydratase